MRQTWKKKRIEEKRFLEQLAKYGPPSSLLLAGPEILLRDLLLTEMHKTVVGKPEEPSWNREVRSARETPLSELTAGLRMVGLFAETRLVIVHDIERYGRSAKAERTDLWDWMERPSPGIYLVLLSEKPLWELERANQFLKGTLSRADAVVRLEHPTAERAVEMIRKAATRRYNLDLPQEVARRLVDAVGPNLLELSHELDRLALRLGPGAKVTVDQLENWLRAGIVGGIRDLEEAILAGDRRRSLRYWDAVPRRPTRPAATGMLGSRHLAPGWGGGRSDGARVRSRYLSLVLRECYGIEYGVKKGDIPSTLQEAAFEAMVWDLCERRGQSCSQRPGR